MTRTIAPTDLDPATLRKLRDLTKDDWFREPIVCEGRKMWKGMDGYFLSIDGDPTVYLYRDVWSALLALIGEGDE